MQRSITFGLLVLALFVAPALALDPPDAKVNPQNSHIETAHVSWTGSAYVVRHSDDDGSEPPETTTLETCASFCDGARIEISTAGDTWEVWWRDGSVAEVVSRKLAYGGSWGSTRVLSEDDEDSRNSEISRFGSQTWVVFEAEQSGGTGVAVNVIIDDPDPIGTRVILRTTAYSGDVDSQIRNESGHLWVTWVDSGTQVGWSEYASGSWSSPAYESYSGSTIATARARIRVHVLGL